MPHQSNNPGGVAFIVLLLTPGGTGAIGSPALDEPRGRLSRFSADGTALKMEMCIMGSAVTKR
jgi:hypothetical protein